MVTLSALTSVVLSSFTFTVKIKEHSPGYSGV